MADSIDASVLDEACGEALRFNMQRIAQIKSLCLQSCRNAPKPDAPKLTQSHECIRELNEYQNHFNRMVEPV